MAYTKQTWVNNETPCDAEHMNHIEDGIGNSLTNENIKTGKITSDNDAYSCNYVNNIINNVSSRKVATAFLTTNLTNIESSIKIPFQGIESNTNALTLSSDGGIKIGAGISKILVSANYFSSADTSDGYSWSKISKNNDDVSFAIDQNNTYFASCAHTPKIVTVTEGDVLYLWKWDENKCNIRGANTNTWLTVEIVG
nr:MAG TPA: hypothetical protein [Caudoviricetes sp.]